MVFAASAIRAGSEVNRRTKMCPAVWARINRIVVYPALKKKMKRWAFFTRSGCPAP